jgi:hypothetical protein
VKVSAPKWGRPERVDCAYAPLSSTRRFGDRPDEGAPVTDPTESILADARQGLGLEPAADDACPECKHSFIVAPTAPSWLGRLFRMKPRPVECGFPDYDMSGWPALDCGCRNPIHTAA